MLLGKPRLRVQGSRLRAQGRGIRAEYWNRGCKVYDKKGCAKDHKKQRDSLLWALEASVCKSDMAVDCGLHPHTRCSAHMHTHMHAPHRHAHAHTRHVHARTAPCSEAW